MLHKRLAAVAVAAIMVTAFSVMPADAAKADAAKKEKRYRSDTTSLDGRTTGQPRTCGYDTFQYDSRGVTRGPYCH